ncbi:MAG: type VI secretion system tip protein VgrG [Gammaproteobacteria bacterium]
MPDFTPHTFKSTLFAQIQSLITPFASDKRLYELTLKDTQDSHINLGAGGLLVEAFAAVEALHAIGARDIIVLSTHAHIELKTLLGQTASLQVSLSDGTRTTFTGLINQFAALGSDGGLARYRVRLVPWLWCLSQSHASRVWQDKTVLEIIESVFARHAPYAAWALSDEIMPFLEEVRPRSFCAQYRESDFDFVSRLLTEEGLSWRIEEHADAHSGHRVVLFADSTQTGAFPEDPSSATLLGGSGIRFHGASSREEQDTIQALTATRILPVALTTLSSTDYKSKRAVTASAPTHHDYGGKHAPALESYDTPGAYAWTSAAEAQRYAQLHQEAHEARTKHWQARSTVRTLRPGTRFTLTQVPLQSLGTPDPQYAVLSVTSVGINNLPAPVRAGLAELFGALPELLDDCLYALRTDARAPWQAGDLQSSAATDIMDMSPAEMDKSLNLDFQARAPDLQDVIEQAQKLGYANRLTAIRADIPWRPVLANGLGTRLNPRPTAPGSQSAIVVGAHGETTPNGADEIYCDRLGRVRIRFHWQDPSEDSSGSTAWVRVAQRSAGNGMGSHFLPRIGQEVLVQFLESDIDRPVIIGALYNGQGEGGIAPTPGGAVIPAGRAPGTDPNAPDVYSHATDHRPSAQGNLAGGHSPVWHGGSPNSPGHRNPAALWGIRTKEFGGRGYNQLLFDDSDQQGRVQLKTTQAATELNLGHLIHNPDNHRGSFRGLGVELRTDAYGAVRAGAGLLISSYGIAHNATTRDPAGDNAPGLAHLKQARILANSFSGAATTHQSVTYASHRGSTQANASHINDKAAPLDALFNAAAGMLDQTRLDAALTDAHNKSTAPGDDKLPHSTDPIIAIAAKAGLGVVAGQSIQLNNGETLAVMSGQDSQFISGGQLRMHSGQAIGMLAGAVNPGDNNTGLQLIAAQGPVDIQAQSDTLKIQAKDEINIMSAHAHIDWAAAKSIKLSVAGGASITIAGGGITFAGPGKILIQAGVKSFDGPTSLSREMNTWPTSKFDEEFILQLPSGKIAPNLKFEVTRADGSKIRGASDAQGRTGLQKGQVVDVLDVKILPRNA